MIVFCRHDRNSLWGHCRATLEVHGEAKEGIQKAGAVNRARRAKHFPLEVPDSVGQRGGDVGRAAKEIQRVIEAENPCAGVSRGARNRDCLIKENAAGEVGVGQDDRIPMDRRNDVGPRSQVLGVADGAGQANARKQTGDAQLGNRRHHRAQPLLKPTCFGLLPQGRNPLTFLPQRRRGTESQKKQLGSVSL